MQNLPTMTGKTVFQGSNNEAYPNKTINPMSSSAGLTSSSQSTSDQVTCEVFLFTLTAIPAARRQYLALSFNTFIGA